MGSERRREKFCVHGIPKDRKCNLCLGDLRAVAKEVGGVYL